MKKIDIIIPTLLHTKIDIFRYTLEMLNVHPLVGKIIILDNTEKCEFVHVFSDIITDKYKIVANGTNYFVNPAWNMGVELCESEYYIILNDDVLCNKTPITQTVKVLDECPNIGIVTIKTINKVDIKDYDNIIKQFVIGDGIFTENIPNNRIGWYMAGRVVNWVNIPKEFKIYYGDDFIFKENHLLGLKSVMLTNCVISHFQGSTSKGLNCHNTIYLEEGNKWVVYSKKYKGV